MPARAPPPSRHRFHQEASCSTSSSTRRSNVVRRPRVTRRRQSESSSIVPSTSRSSSFDPERSASGFVSVDSHRLRKPSTLGEPRSTEARTRRTRRGSDSITRFGRRFRHSTRRRSCDRVDVSSGGLSPSLRPSRDARILRAAPGFVGHLTCREKRAERSRRPRMASGSALGSRFRGRQSTAEREGETEHPRRDPDGARAWPLGSRASRATRSLCLRNRTRTIRGRRGTSRNPARGAGRGCSNGRGQSVAGRRPHHDGADASLLRKPLEEEALACRGAPTSAALDS